MQYTVYLFLSDTVCLAVGISLFIDLVISFEHEQVLNKDENPLHGAYGFN